MCKSVSRDYVATSLDVEVVGNFASAAVMSVLEPSDWQVSQDVRHAAVELAGAAIDRRAGEVGVTITVHAEHLEVQVASAGGTTRREIRPRVAFATSVSCDLHA